MVGGMGELKRVSVTEAKRLLDEGYTYVDVRTSEEFAVRHPSGAVNVPLSRLGPAGATENPDFLTDIMQRFGRSARLVVGCATGQRSRWAAAMLLEAGFENVVEMRAGLEGARSAFGQKVEKGWADEGLPMSSDSVESPKV